MNKAMVIGNVGQEPRFTTFPEGSIASFTIATNKKGFTLQSGKVIPDTTDWHNIVCRRPHLVERVQRYIHKGSKLFVEGEMHTRKYTGSDNREHYIMEIVAENMEMLDPRPQQAQPVQQVQPQGIVQTMQAQQQRPAAPVYQQQTLQPEQPAQPQQPIDQLPF